MKSNALFKTQNFKVIHKETKRNSFFRSIRPFFNTQKTVSLPAKHHSTCKNENGGTENGKCHKLLTSNNFLYNCLYK